MSLIPDAIQSTLIRGSSKLAWAILRDDRVVEFGGAIEQHGLRRLVKGATVPADLPWASVVAPGPLGD